MTSYHVLYPYLPENQYQHYHLRQRLHNKALIPVPKTTYLSDRDQAISCACCTRTVNSLLQYCHHPLCLCCLLFQRRLSFYLFHYCYVCTSVRLILYFISQIFNLLINVHVALPLTKLLLKKVTATMQLQRGRSEEDSSRKTSPHHRRPLRYLQQTDSLDLLLAP